jgi:hypothetical protein
MGRRLLRKSRPGAEREGDEKELQVAFQIDARGHERAPIRGAAEVLGKTGKIIDVPAV